MNRKVFLAAVIVAFTPVLGFVSPSTNTYQYDSADATSVVKACYKMMLAADFNAMLDVTSGSANTKTQDIIDSMRDTPTLLGEVKAAVKNITDFEIVRTDYFTNQAKFYSIVATRWTVKSTTTADPGTKLILPSQGEEGPRGFTVVQVDYLLQLIDSKWKIISQRSR